MKKLYLNFTVIEQCHLFDVRSSRFYYEAKLAIVENEILRGTIKRIFDASGQTYAKSRIQAELKDLGDQAGVYGNI